MNKILFFFITLFFAANAAAAEKGRATYFDPESGVVTEEMALGGRAEVIVEFRGVPAALEQGETARARGEAATARAELFARFRRDLGGLQARVASDGGGALRDRGPRIAHEYSNALVGAAVSVPAEMVEHLRRLPYVRGVYRDKSVYALQSESQISAAARINAIGVPSRGQGMKVAVLDSGVDYRHDAFGGGFGPGFKVSGGYDFVNDDADPMDDNGHGTHVAAIIAAYGGGLVGVAPSASLFAYKVLGPTGAGKISDTLAAIERALDPNGDGHFSDRADIINLSLGSAAGTADDPEARAIDNAVAAGVVVCIAAGNSGRVGTIGTPGAARLAITVGAAKSNGEVADFSSRGPTPGLLTFKPDLIAPGEGIVSARLGGGHAAMSGSSMATAHVAGAAALLKALYTNWTPARIKLALTLGAIPVQGDGFVRGAGRIDVDRATRVRLSVSDTGISFGINAAETGTTTETRTITITNHDTEPMTLQVSDATGPSGVTIAVSPAQFQLAPGQSRELTVQMTSNNAAFAFASGMTAGGEIFFTGSASFAIPWAVVRASRLTVTFDGPIVSARLFGRGVGGGLVPTSDRGGERFVPRNTKLDITIAGLRAADDPALRVIFVEEKVIKGDEVVALTSADAPHRLHFNGRGPDGARLADRELVAGRRGTITWFGYNYAQDGMIFHGAYGLPALSDIYVSKVSPRYELYASEHYVDIDGTRAINVQYAPLRGISEGTTFTNAESDFLHARVRWRANIAQSRQFAACPTVAQIVPGSSIVLGPIGCFERPLNADVLFDYYTTPERGPGAFSGIRFAGVEMVSETFRGIGDAIVSTNEPVPPPTALRIAHRGEVTLGLGLPYPFAFPGTIGNATSNNPPQGFKGQLGEHVNRLTHFTLVDQSGATVSSGSFLRNQRGVIPPVKPGWTLTATSGEFVTGPKGASARVTLETRFAAAANDLVAPTFTSLQLRDATGTPADVVRRGENATLHFSIADYVYEIGDVRTTPARSDATRVLYRLEGGSQWLPLTVQPAGTDYGSRQNLRRLPVGEMYTIDLGAVTAAVGTVDLRFEAADQAGNAVTWTVERAFIVSDAQRRPAVGR